MKKVLAVLGGKIGLRLSDSQRSSKDGAVSHFSSFPLNFVRPMQGFAYELVFTTEWPDEDSRGAEYN
jgi:hypothetical protein